MSTDTITPELVLVREKAARLSNLELTTEIERCQYGMQVASTKTAAARFERRLEIMRSEFERRARTQGGQTTRRPFRVDIANADELDRQVLATVVSLVGDPKLKDLYQAFRRGALTISVDGGHVSLRPMDRTEVPL
jgi:hypothetical protein